MVFTSALFLLIFLESVISLLVVDSLTMNSWENNLRDIIVKNKRVVESKYITFTTVSELGWPAARTVVFRGFHNQDNKIYLKFISDSRSQKILDLEKCNKVELCWYLTKNKDQFRIKGYGTSIGLESTDERNLKLRISTWNGLSDGARAPFFFPGNPGDEVDESGGNVIDSSSQSKAALASSLLPFENQEEIGGGNLVVEDVQFNTKKNKKFIPVIPDADTVKALRAERKTGEEEPSKINVPPPDCFNIILVDPLSGILIS